MGSKADGSKGEGNKGVGDEDEDLKVNAAII